MEYDFNSTQNTINVDVDDRQMYINVNVELLPKVLDFLLSNKLPFSLNFIPTPKNQNAMTEQAIIIKNSTEKLSNSGNRIPFRNKYEIIANEIYDKYIKNITSSLAPTLNEISVEFEISTVTLKKIFIKYYGKQFFQLYKDSRMEYAAKLLKEGLTATIVSERIGYSHPIKFNKMFQKHFGITPKKYQMQERKL